MCVCSDRGKIAVAQTAVTVDLPHRSLVISRKIKFISDIVAI